MDTELKDRFTAQWRKYFGDAELPITFYYTDEESRAEKAEVDEVPSCVISMLNLVREGKSLSFDVNSIGCFGGRRYLGFTKKISPNFEYFLSCGIPGKVEGERYKKSPELVREAILLAPPFEAPHRFIIFKRWDMLDASDDPEVVIFYAQPDVLSGLFTLANFEEPEPNAVYAPFGSGCASIVQYPYLENDSNRPRCVIGLFDISARPFAPTNALSFSAPMKKFTRMVENIEESFLTTDSWRKVRKRIEAL